MSLPRSASPIITVKGVDNLYSLSDPGRNLHYACYQYHTYTTQHWDSSFTSRRRRVVCICVPPEIVPSESENTDDRSTVVGNLPQGILWLYIGAFMPTPSGKARFFSLSLSDVFMILRPRVRWQDSLFRTRLIENHQSLQIQSSSMRGVAARACAPWVGLIVAAACVFMAVGVDSSGMSPYK